MAKHAVLGAGGVGGLIGGLLAQAGEGVVLVLRPEAAANYPAQLHVKRPSGEFRVAVQHVARLEAPVDVLWVTVKETQLAAALSQVPPSPAASVISLLNGIDHIDELRARYGNTVVPGTIAVESERVAPGVIVQHSPFLRVNLSAGGEARLAGVAQKLRSVQCGCDFHADEVTMLWTKLAFLAPFALTTTAAQRDFGGILGEAAWEARFRDCMKETCAVANAAGAKVSFEKGMEIAGILPRSMRSSMQRDLEAHRLPELDAIAGPIIRGGARHKIPVPVTQELVSHIEQQWRAVAPQSSGDLLRRAAKSA
jgi:2-dehydropantoate 2-reductase